MNEEKEYLILKFFKDKGVPAAQQEMGKYLSSIGFVVTGWDFDDVVKLQWYNTTQNSN